MSDIFQIRRMKRGGRMVSGMKAQERTTIPTIVVNRME